jgi:hypothetical protein
MRIGVLNVRPMKTRVNWTGAALGGRAGAMHVGLGGRASKPNSDGMGGGPSMLASGFMPPSFWSLPPLHAGIAHAPAKTTPKK